MKHIKLFREMSVTEHHPAGDRYSDLFNPRVKVNGIYKIVRFNQYEKIYESKKTETEGISILTKRGNKNHDSVMIVIKDIDKSVNQKNIPLIASIWEDDSDIELFKQTFSLYDSMVNKGRIKPFSPVRGGGIKNTEREISVKDGILKLSEYLHSKNSTVGKSLSSDKLEADDKPIFDKNGIKIYPADSANKCQRYAHGALNGKDYSFCIGAMGTNNLYDQYRLEGSTFYFIVDNNMDDGDPLELVVYDARGPEGEAILTDSNNDTGNISKYGEDVYGYQEYLRSKGVDVDKLMVAKPLTQLEREDMDAIAKENDSIDWWKNLPHRVKILYSAKHILTDDQFKYSLEDKEVMSKYSSAGGEIPESQYDQMKPANKKSYIRSRAILLFNSEYGGEIREFEKKEFMENSNYFKKIIELYGDLDHDEIPFENDKLMEIYVKEIRYIDKKIYDKLKPQFREVYLKKVADKIDTGSYSVQDLELIKENPVLLRSFNKAALSLLKSNLEFLRPIPKNAIDLLDKNKLGEIQKIGSLYDEDIKLKSYGGITGFKESLKGDKRDSHLMNTDKKNNYYIIGVNDNLFNEFPNDVKDVYIDYVKSAGDGNYYLSPLQERYVIGTKEAGDASIYRISRLPMNMMMLELGNSTSELIEEFKKTMGENYIIDRIIDYMKYGKIKKDDKFLYITKKQKEKLLSEEDCEKILETGYFWGLDQKKAEELYSIHYTMGDDVIGTIGIAARDYIYASAAPYNYSGAPQNPEDKRVHITLSDLAFDELNDAKFNGNPEETFTPNGKGYYLSLMTKLPSFGLTKHQGRVKNNYK
jgi:hypothetical protein